MADNAPRVAGVRFRNAGKIFYFHASGMRLEVGEYVVVESVRGPEVAKVVIAPDQVVVNELGREDLKPILRLATDDDIQRADTLKGKVEALLVEARAIAQDAGFPARIDDGEFTLDGRRLTLSFTSEERIDYRDFVRRAADRFKVKVDMRQLGARDRAKLAGGYGICGRELCCSSWLSTFPSISIRMAKEQELPLNPQKISGLCGRLLCCLSYEEEGYREMRKTLPKVGQRCSTPTGEGKVIGVNILRRQVTLYVEGQRVEVGDRDLGTVVRWDTSSRSAEPPPSMSRAEAIEQGLIEADEIDLAGDTGDAEESAWAALEAGVGRGRLPGGGPRKVVPSRDRGPRPGSRPEGRASGPPQSESPADAPGRDRGGRGRSRGRGGRPEGPSSEPRRTPPADLPQGRSFQRSQPGPSQASERPPRAPENEAPSGEPGNEGQGGGGRRRRRGRGGRGPGAGGGEPGANQSPER
ncbi:MAG: regulatory iron-sulfur-containing complex subunit RicT [Dehalococcoidia bacterium]